MKHLPLLFILLCCGIVKANNPFGFQRVTLKSPPKEYRSILALPLKADSIGTLRDPELYKIEKQTHKGKVMTITGATLLGASPVLFLGGTALIVYSGDGSYYPSAAAITGGAFCYILGAGCLATGLPLTIAGAIKWSTGKYEKKLYMEMRGLYTGNRAGVQLTF